MNKTWQEKGSCSGVGSVVPWSVRPAGEADVERLVALRRALFREMGYRDEALLDQMAEASGRYFAIALPAGEFRAWVADAGGEMLACGGVVIHSAPPTTRNLKGQEGYIMNMYTLPVWRHRGIGTAILQAILEHLRGRGIPLVSLHASRDGSRLYARHGFEPTNEMRLYLKKSVHDCEGVICGGETKQT